jgi:hypothetical protein
MICDIVMPKSVLIREGNLTSIPNLLLKLTSGDAASIRQRSSRPRLADRIDGGLKLSDSLN